MRCITYYPATESRRLNQTTLSESYFSPAINIVEKDQGYYLDLISPGLQKDDFKIELKNKQLTISVDKKSDLETTDNNKVWRKEYSVHSFQRSFYLPDTVVGDAVEATYEQGILKLFIPKKTEAIPTVKTIKID